MNGGVWKIGDVTVTRIVEMETTGGMRFLLPQASPEAISAIDWLTPHFANEEGKIKMSFHAFVVEAPGRRIIVDTCIGNDKPRSTPTWSHLQTEFLKDLTDEGFAPETIDTVLCTHLHIDHVGWNTKLVDGAWEPTFTKARYLMAKSEYDYFIADDDKEQMQIMSDSVTPVFEAGLVDLVETNHRVCDEIRLIPSHGHTPGHVSIWIESQGQTGLITGDFVHHPCQMHHPEWSAIIDTNPQDSEQTRRALFETCTEQGTLVIGTHFAAPTAGTLVRNGDGWQLMVD